MAIAICTQCGKEYWWPARRSYRLKDFPSRCCHTPGRARRTGFYAAPDPAMIGVPTIIADFWWLNGNTWIYSPTRRIRLLRNGEVEFKNWFSIVKPGQLRAGMRHFSNELGGIMAKEFMLREEDYQRLLAKREVSHVTR